MGVYIKGMEMPTSEEKCKFIQPAPFRAPFCVINGVCHGIDDCPLVPVPSHGDLIDRDACIDYIRDNDQHAWEALAYAPTIIPASKEGE